VNILAVEAFGGGAYSSSDEEDQDSEEDENIVNLPAAEPVGRGWPC